jgi:HD-GYP domain-containing protein (c-di-GMP phosphodiesterase class II)
MTLEIQLRFTPDLASAVDVPGLAAYGIEALPLPLAELATSAPAARGRTQRAFLVSAAALAEGGRRATAVLRVLAEDGGRRGAPAVILVGAEQAVESGRRYASAHTPEVPGAAALAALVRSALETARLRIELAATRRAVAESRSALAVRDSALNELQRVAIALSAERNADTLQQLILTKSRELTSADAGSLYLVEEDPSTGGKLLRFQWSQNDTRPDDYVHRIAIPISPQSMAGYVALTGEVVSVADVYNLPPGVPYGFNPAFDQATGYRTRSMLLVPMVSHDGDVVGVIQLINRKRHFDVRLDSRETAKREVIPFDEACDRLLRSFASQAAVGLDNQQLLESIQKLFDGFVDASVQAIESRDPTTSGHSRRVADLSVALADRTNACGRDYLADIYFSDAEIRELRYAAVLHDFGKVGVREHVLIKAKKLYPWQLKSLEERFATARALLVAHHSRRDIEYLLTHGVDGYRAVQTDREAMLAAALADLERDLAVVRQCNEPTVLEEDRRAHLVEVAARRFADLGGNERLLLEPTELDMLSIPRGSLNDEERREIESHVTHTVRFLRLIPWTKDLSNIAKIAGAHHEKLNGRGYPSALPGDDIPVQSRIMTISDIYDALTARDRPYKRAVPIDAALNILRKEAEGGMIDGTLLELFIGEGVFEVVRPPREEEEAELAAAR